MLNPYHFYRVSHYLYTRKVPFLPKMTDYFVRLIFGCWLPHTAKIGKGLKLGYGGMCVVIHSNAVIGDNVHIDQGVTLGGNATEYGAPKIGNNIYIGCGAKVLGPVTVGDGVVIGANAVVIQDVPANTVAAGVPAHIIHENIDISEYLYHL